ncbi:MAG: hypothetical protein WCX73_05730 [Candidatus Pacearchaeota archaeon]
MSNEKTYRVEVLRKTQEANKGNWVIFQDLNEDNAKELVEGLIRSRKTFKLIELNRIGLQTDLKEWIGGNQTVGEVK